MNDVDRSNLQLISMMSQTCVCHYTVYELDLVATVAQVRMHVHVFVICLRIHGPFIVNWCLVHKAPQHCYGFIHALLANNVMQHMHMLYMYM